SAGSSRPRDGTPSRAQPTRSPLGSTDGACDSLPGGRGRTTRERDVTNRCSKCQWGADSLALASFGNHFACSAGSTRICESTFHPPSSRTRVYSSYSVSPRVLTKRSCDSRTFGTCAFSPSTFPG